MTYREQIDGVRDRRPADVEREHRERIARLEQQAALMPVIRRGNGRPCKPVVNDRGDWYGSLAEAAKRYGVTSAAIRLAIVKRCKAKGFTWEYA